MMNLATIALASCVTVALSTSAYAAAIPARVAGAEPKLSTTYKRCMDASEGVTVEMHDCMSAEYERQDARLNTTYKAMLAHLSPGEQTKLRTIERRWLKTTKATCDHAGDDNEGGTLQTIQILDCYLSETAKRADALVRYQP